MASFDIAVLIHENAWLKAIPDVEEYVTKIVHHTLENASLPAAEKIEIAVVLTGDTEIQKLNAQYRGKDKPTNVLSFPASEEASNDKEVPVNLGDILLAYETIQREAQAQEKLFAHHVAHLLIHGTLHLLGYDHENDAEADTMESKEAALLAALGIANPYLTGDAAS